MDVELKMEEELNNDGSSIKNILQDTYTQNEYTAVVSNRDCHREAQIILEVQSSLKS